MHVFLYDKEITPKSRQPILTINSYAIEQQYK